MIDEHEEICSNGHLEDCEALTPAYSLEDIMYGKPCTGCCPHGYKPKGIQAQQDTMTVNHNIQNL